MSGNVHSLYNRPLVLKRFSSLILLLCCFASQVSAKTETLQSVPASVTSLSSEELEKLPNNRPPVATLVSAMRREIPVEDATRSVTVITKPEIDRSGKTMVLDLLRGVPGVMVTQSGGFGRESNIFIRGFNKESTLVMLDGVQINNPNQSLASLEHLTTANIEQIEIVRGPQSVLYGADAAGGLVNIVTKPQADKGIHGGAKASFGTYETFYEEAHLSGAAERFSFNTAGSRMDSEGLSENDDYENTTARFNGRLNITENSDFDFAFHHYNSITGLDQGAFNQDPNANSRSNQQVVNTKYTISLAEWWQQSAKYSLFHDSGLNVNPRDLPGSGADEAALFKINSNRHTFEYQSNFYIKDFDVLTVGYEFEHTNTKSKSSGLYERLTRNHGWFAQNELTLWKIWTLVAGIRFDQHELYGVEASPLFSTGLWIEKTKTKLKGSFGRGFRSPTFNQLFSPISNFGNPNLLPETSWAWDAGFEQFYWEERGSFSATFFDARIKNLIVNTFPASNVGSARSQGVELEHRIKLYEGLHFNTNYTYTHSINRETEKRIARIPRHMGKFGLSYDYERLHLTADWIWVGSRDDGTTRLDEYTKLDLALFFDVTDWAQIYGRVDNATNDEYYEARGFDTLHTAFTVGTKAKF
jgi:vitamin B12 transporter